MAVSPVQKVADRRYHEPDCSAVPKTGALRTLTGHIQRKAEKVIKIIGPRHQAEQALTDIYGVLDDMAVATSRGERWSAIQVMRVLERLGWGN